MTKPVLVSLARRFATMAALLAGIAMLMIAGTSWWLINQEHTASVRSLLKQDAELQATRTSSHLVEIAGRMSELANSSLITNALLDSSDKERYLIPYLSGIQRINDISVDILFTDFAGREIASNDNGSFSEQELNWLKEKLLAGQHTSRVQLGEKGEELIAVEFIVLAGSNSVEGALLYRIKLDELALHTLHSKARLVRGKEPEHLLHSPTVIAAAVDVPPIYKHLDFAVLTSPDPTARWVGWQSLWVFSILAVGLVVMVIFLGMYFGKRLTRDLRGLEFFARSIAGGGFRATRVEAASGLEASGLEASGLEASGLEVDSLAQSINRMLERLKQEHDNLNESEERFRKQSQSLSEVIWATDIGTWEWNVQTGETVFNKRWAEIVGYTLDELAPISINTWSKLVHPDDGKRSGELLTQCFNRESEAYICEARMRHKNGAWVWVLDRGRVVEWTEDGKPLRMSGTHQEITEQKLAQDEILRLNTGLEERVQQRTEELASYIQAIGQHAIISVADLAGDIIQSNDRFCEISGYTQAELLGQNHRIVNSGTHPKEFFAHLWATITRGDTWRGEFCNRAKDGSLYWVDSAIVPIKDSHGQITRYISVRIDITGRKQTEAEMVRLNVSLEERVQQLHNQQEELRQSNEGLEENNRLLAEQKVEVEYKNREIEAAKLTLEEKAEQLTLTSKYKSEFLSSMSHELRTPLNSLLILAQLLAENAEHSMSAQQIEYAKVIQGAGKDLLELINDILDLSKIESGTVTLEFQDVSLANVHEQVERAFRHVAQSRSIGFGVELAPSLPPSLYTDAQRLQQVLKNLLSNAFKFTEKGQVSVRIAPVESGWGVDHDGLKHAQTVIGFFVTDTGIGLQADKQKIIFEAFQQAYTGTARRYGGTGLGLSISREIAWLLGGELRLAESSPGQGSTFVLYLPLRAPEPGQGRTSSLAETMPLREINQEISSNSAVGSRTSRPHADGASAIPVVADDRTSIKPGERTLLIIEDDARFAGILLRAARDKGFKGIVAARGDDGLKLAGEFKPTAIMLDLHLPDMDGWVVLERLKRNFDTRHIPVEIISVEDNRLRGLRYGAFEYLVKPVTAESLQKALADVNKFAEREVKDLFVADRDEQHRKNVLDLISSGDDVRIKVVASGKDALAALKKKRYDCIVLDLHLPDIRVVDLLEAIQGLALTHDVPVIIYGMDELPQQEQERLKSLALKGIVKEVRTPERLLDETALFLHRVVSKLPEEQRQMLEKLYLSTDSLAGKKVLVVDDDVRNIFALTAVLERHKMIVLVAESGRAALEELVQNQDVDIVLMDIMMPEMDGFEAMRHIRKMKQFESLPMIALTAKAMKGDREKCIASGASDYVSKPVDTNQLLSLLLAWLYR